MRQLKHGRWLRIPGGLLLLWCLLPAEAQAVSRSIAVYNPQVYGRTRQTMSDRAVRRALERKKQPSVTPGAPSPSPKALSPSVSD